MSADNATNLTPVETKSTEVGAKENIREKIAAFETILSQVPGAVFGDTDQMPLKHTFADGVYVREIFIPKGFALTGKLHRHAHPNFLMKGEVMVVTENGGKEHLKAPLSMISQPGTKRAIYALEDTVWITVHATNETDLEKIEEHVIAKNYDELVLIESPLFAKNCLVLALKELGREYRFLADLKADGILLPFKQAVEKLKRYNVSLDGMFVSKNESGEYHVSTGGDGVLLRDFVPSETDWVGTWAAVAVGAGTAVGGYFAGQGGGSTSQSQGPMMTPEQAAAQAWLGNFMRTGKMGDFTAGGDAGVKMGNWSMSPTETMGQSQLQQLLASGIPDQYKMGNDALASILNPDPNAIASQFDPFKQQTERQISQSNRDLMRNAGFAGNLYSSNTIRGLGDIQARGNETLTSQLASLTNDALNRRMQAIPLAYQAGTAQENLTQGRIAASQQYGGLDRALTNAGIEQANAETLRRRNESLMPYETAKTLSTANTQFGVPSVSVPNQNPMLDLLTAVIGAGGRYLGSRGGGTPTPVQTTSPNMGPNLNLTGYPYYTAG